MTELPQVDSRPESDRKRLDGIHSKSPGTNRRRPVGRGAARNTIVFIDPQTFSRDCITQSLLLWYTDVVEVMSFASASAAAMSGITADAVVLILVNIHHQRITDVKVEQDLTILDELFSGTPFALLADSDNIDQILAALARSVRGYILTSAPLSVAVEAIRLVCAGGTFIPASCLTGSATFAAGLGKRIAGYTPRQVAVLRQLRKGRPNKIIAHELEMSESTVKAHVRNIMKKLGATNRTEVVSLTQEIFQEENGA